MKIRVTRSIVPNLFTLANLFMGFTAIVNISDGKYGRAAIFVLVAGIFDMLDGVMARLTRSTSEFGVELDSLCDAVSFGVAPSYMLYEVFFHQYNDFGILLASLPALAGVVRLARFNVQLSSFEDKKYFTGLPIPSGALTILSYIVFYHQTDIIPENWKPVLMFVIAIIIPAAMVSRIKYDNLPRPSKRSFSQRPVFFILFMAGLVISIATLGKGVFPVMLVYLVASALRHFYYWIKSVREASDDIDESISPEQET